MSTRDYLHGQGKAAVYLSEDRTEILTEHPDGMIEREPYVHNRADDEPFDHLPAPVHRKDRAPNR